MLAGVLGRYALTLPIYFDDLVGRFKVLRGPFMVERCTETVGSLCLAFAVCAVAILVICFLGLMVKRGWSLALLRKGYVIGYVAFFIFLLVVMKITGVVMSRNLVIDEVATNPIIVFYWRLDALWLPACVMVVLAFLHVLSWRRAVISYYTGVQDDTPALGDRILENVRTNGPDPMFRKSVLSSVSLHISVIILIPLLLSLHGGCVEPYRIQKGSGTSDFGGSKPVVVKKVVKKKKQKKYLLNKQSSISFHIPTLDESKVSEQVEKDTQLVYEANPMRVRDGSAGYGPGGGGKMGVGNKNGPGGWPEGSENAKFRFIRLEYNGSGWDDGMDAVSRADMNFLDAFRKMTGFKTAEASESHAIALLKKYPKGLAPPFVYMTGNGDINVPEGDKKILRAYLMDGGMLFADCGSPRWDGSFRSFIQSVLPGQALCVIADDDPIFQIPWPFPNGAPPIWHHGGRRALGIKNKDRWIVFYHPGDINDAWKTGHGGLDPDMAKGAIEMGINIVYYAFTHYLEATRKYRK